MKCSKCGRPLQPNEICNCSPPRKSGVRTDIMPDEFLAGIERAEKTAKEERKKKERKILTIVIISGFIFPIIWIGYIVYRNRKTVMKILEFFAPPSGSNNDNRTVDGGSTSGSEVDEGSVEKKFGFRGGDGNLYESGGMFCDWNGDYIEWGKPFHDHRGNYVGWGEPFYDNRDNYVSWGSSFYDADDNYVNPRG